MLGIASGEQELAKMMHKPGGILEMPNIQPRLIYWTNYS